MQISSPAIALIVLWLARAVQSRRTEPGTAMAARPLGLLALLLAVRDRERFVGEVPANLADLRWRQRADELLSVAGALSGWR